MNTTYDIRQIRHETFFIFYFFTVPKLGRYSRLTRNSYTCISVSLTDISIHATKPANSLKEDEIYLIKHTHTHTLLFVFGYYNFVSNTSRVPLTLQNLTLGGLTKQTFTPLVV